MFVMLKLLGAVITAFMSTISAPQYGGAPPESSEARQDRLDLIQVAIVDAALNQEYFDAKDAALLVTTVFYHESQYEYYVHTGSCRSPLGHQDHGKARCMGQLHTWAGNRIITPEEYAALTGADYVSTRNCVEATLKYLYWQARGCLRGWRTGTPITNDQALRTFAAYGAGRCIKPYSGSWRRLRTFARLRRNVGGL